MIIYLLHYNKFSYKTWGIDLVLFLMTLPLWIPETSFFKYNLKSMSQETG